MKFNKHKQKTFCQIVPSDFFQQFTDTGTGKQKESAYLNIEISERIRGRREIAGKMFGMFISEGQKNRTIYNANNLETLPGSLVRREGESNSGDACTDV